jgi:hypothetical protein
LIRSSPIEFGSTIFFRKADGSLRQCINYRGLNEVTRKDANPLPRVDDTLMNSRTQFFTHISFYNSLANGKLECVIKTSTKLRVKQFEI